ncbi:MAG: hypothetical protein ACE5NA_04570 [Nitrospiraceae bacterium]
MALRYPAMRLLVAFGLVFLLAATGCATSKDIQGLDQAMSGKLNTLDASVQAQVAGLQAELKKIRDNQERLDKQLDAVRSDTVSAVARLETGQAETNRRLMEELKTNTATALAVQGDLKQLDEGMNQKMDALGRTVQLQLETLQDESNKALQRIEAMNEQLKEGTVAVQSAVATVDQLPARLSGLTAEMHVFQKTLVGNYKLEEAALRERLKLLEQVRMQLQPAAPRRIEAKPAEAVP